MPELTDINYFTADGY